MSLYRYGRGTVPDTVHTVPSLWASVFEFSAFTVLDMNVDACAVPSWYAMVSDCMSALLPIGFTVNGYVVESVFVTGRIRPFAMNLHESVGVVPLIHVRDAMDLVVDEYLNCVHMLSVLPSVAVPAGDLNST